MRVHNETAREITFPEAGDISVDLDHKFNSASFFFPEVGDYF